MKLKRKIWEIILLILLYSCKTYNPIMYDENINYDKYSQILYGKPLIVFIKTDPWLMVVGSDTPLFVLYDSGQLIYKYVENNELKHRFIQLNKNEISDFIKFLDIPDELYGMNEYTSISIDYITDLPYNILYLDFDVKKRIIVYGDLRGYMRENVPRAFLDIYNKIVTYRNKSSIEWFPPKIEIMFSDWPGAKNVRKWIEDYPDLESETSWHHNDIYSVYLNIEHYPEFIDYYNLVKRNNEAVEINGKTMVIRFRFPFPIIGKPYYND